jgi:HEAT repeat protein
MRLFVFALTAGALVCASGFGQDGKKKEVPPGTAGPAGKDEKSDSMKKAPEITEVGGKSLDQWIKETSAKDPSKRENAMRMILNFGPEKAQQAVPAIIAQLKKHSPSTPIDLSARVSGALALGMILSGVEKPDPKNVKDAVAVLRQFCEDPQVIVRTRAAQALGVLARVAPEAHDALKEVIKVAQDKDTYEARQAGIQTLTVLALMDKDPPTPTVLAVYYKALKDNSMQVRTAAVQGLAVFPFKEGDPSHLAIVRNLEDTAKDDVEGSVRIYAHLAVMYQQKKVSTEHLNPIVEMLKHADPSVRAQAAQTITSIGPQAKSATPTLIATLYDPDPNVVVACMIALVQLQAESAVPVLDKIAADPSKDETIKFTAKSAVQEIKSSKEKNDKAGKDKAEKK